VNTARQSGWQIGPSACISASISRMMARLRSGSSVPSASMSSASMRGLDQRLSFHGAPVR